MIQPFYGTTAPPQAPPMDPAHPGPPIPQFYWLQPPPFPVPQQANVNRPPPSKGDTVTLAEYARVVAENGKLQTRILELESTWQKREEEVAKEAAQRERKEQFERRMYYAEQAEEMIQEVYNEVQKEVVGAKDETVRTSEEDGGTFDSLANTVKLIKQRGFDKDGETNSGDHVMGEEDHDTNGDVDMDT